MAALDADSKLIVSYLVGQRDGEAASEFVQDLADRLSNRVQLTMDGLSLYLNAVENAFKWNGVDYAQLVKIYGSSYDAKGAARRRYSPAVCLGAIKEWIMGKPDFDEVSTSYVERQNLTMRMHMRRSTRLTNAFSKKVEYHEYAVALHFMYYNYCRRHQTLTKANRGIMTTPAMAAGLAVRPWAVEDILKSMDSK